VKYVKIEKEMRHFPWGFAAIVEEFRNAGIEIPDDIQRAKDEFLIKINIKRYVRDEYPARRDQVVKFLESVAVPDHLPDRFTKAGSLRFMTEPSDAMRVSIDRYLEDNILGVGLKSYPYVVDWDGVGGKDLLVGDHDGILYLFRNVGKAGQPMFGRGERVKCAVTGADFMAHANPKITIARFCSDGKEFMVLGNYGGTMPIFENRKKSAGYEFTLPEVDHIRSKEGIIDLGNYVYPEAFDWNNDGFPDLIVGTIEGTIYLILNTGNTKSPVFEDPVPIEGIETLMYPHPTMVDWDGDGLTDMLLGHREGTVLFYKNVGEPGKPEFESRGPVLKENGEPVEVYMLSHQCPVSWNDDGIYDLLVGNDSGQVIWFKNIGIPNNPVFSEGEILKDEGGELICGVHPVITFTDWDSDGNLDILVGHQEETLRLFINENGIFDQFQELTDIKYTRKNNENDDEIGRLWKDEGLYFSREYLGNLAPVMVDWDNSGLSDLVMGNYTGLLFHYRNIGEKGNPRFEQGRLLKIEGKPIRVAGFSTPIAVDWNNDGKIDIVCGDLLGRVHLFLNSSDGRGPLFERHAIVEINGEPAQFGPRSIVEVADIDGDGGNEWVISQRYGRICIFKKG